MPQESDFALTDTGFAVKERRYSYSDVDSIYFYYVVASIGSGAQG